MMKKSTFVLLAASVWLGANPVGAGVVVSEDFSSYISGVPIIGTLWDAKDNGGSQQELFSGRDNAFGALDGAAESNYHIPHQTGFTISSGQVAVVCSDFRYVYVGGGQITNNMNKNVFGLLVSTSPDWESGTNNGFYIAQRGGAIGNRLPEAPWVEGWVAHSSLGVNTANADTSNWFRVEWTIRDVSGSLFAKAVLTDGVSVNYTSSEVDLGISTGTELFAGYSTGGNSTGLSIEAFGKISEVHMDNFEVKVVGEAWPLTDPGNSAGWVPYEPMTDEFDGTALDPRKWEAVNWEGRDPVYHEYNNVALVGGHAILTTDLRAAPYTNKYDEVYLYDAGYFQSTTSRRYGYFEIRCRALDFPIMTTWWLTGGSSSYNREIDMLECPSGRPGYEDYYSCNFHIWKTPSAAGVDDNGGNSIPDPEHYTLPFNMIDDFHVYGFEWDKDTCKIYIDGQLYRTRATGSFKVGQRLMVGNEFNDYLSKLSDINANLHKLGNSYDVDYVRAWIKPESDTTWYVDASNGDDDNDGLSWNSAKKSIPAAINETYDGDSIWVAGGIYPEYLTFFGINNLKVYGGFAAGDTSLDDRDPIANPTLIQSPPDGYSTVNIKGCDGFRFDGFTVRGTTASYDHGIEILGVCSNVVIANCRMVDHNPANGGGSGAYVDGVDGQGLAEVRFENCEFSNNRSFGKYAGGAAFGARDGALVEMVDSQMINNYTSGDAGAFTMQWGSENTTVRMTNCLIAANTNQLGRGVIRHNYGTVELVSCTVISNSSDGIESDAYGSPSTIIEDSILMAGGGEGFWANHDNFLLQNNLFFDNPGGHVNRNGDKSTESAINGLAQASGNVVGDPSTLLPDATDSDGDLVPDWWELMNGMTVPGKDAGLDVDGDGLDAFSEYIAGTGPNDSADSFHAAGATEEGIYKVYMPSVLNRLYSVEYTEDLAGDWTALTNGVPGTGSLIEILDPLSSNRFYRTTVELE
ncbi:family 16 glycosylhydrolase [Pontiellaceae bacterium B12227]|nr:family 16 glycosylhydrolase [Pontiellaceae bacterium B12227]